MSKSKNKGQKPQQNENNKADELEAKAEEIIDTADEVTDGKVTLEAEEKASEAEEEIVSEDVKAKEDAGSEGGEEEAEAFRKLHFIEKCKKDPIIPVCIILAILALIVAGIYFLLPNAMTPSMGMTLKDFQTRYNNGDVAASLLNSGVDITFRSPEYVDITAHPSILGDKAVISAKSAYADFFDGPFKYTSIGGVEGAARKSDENLSYVRVYVQYGDDDFNTVWLYASNTIDALFPELSMYEAMDVGMKMMNEYNGDTRFYVKGDYAFRLVAVKKTADGGGEIVYIVMDCVPRSSINESQIREDIEAEFPSPSVSESAVQTAAST